MAEPNKNPVVTAESDISGKKQRASKIKGIEWSKLGVDKDPEFNKSYVLYGVLGSKETATDDFRTGELESINTSSTGSKYNWQVDGDDLPRNHFTHFALCVKPVE